MYVGGYYGVDRGWMCLNHSLKRSRRAIDDVCYHMGFYPVLKIRLLDVMDLDPIISLLHELINRLDAVNISILDCLLRKDQSSG